MNDSLIGIHRDIVECARCPRLVEYRARIAREKRRAYRDWEYWGKPVPGFGDPKAKMLILGLAPAAHGGNRTGRVFTGDRSGDFLFAALHRAGFANQPESVSLDDGLSLKDAYITASVRCAPPDNKPLPSEAANCRDFTLREVAALKSVRVTIALGRFAFDTYLSIQRGRGAISPEVRPVFAHCAVYKFEDAPTLIASYHPSQQNTQTGRLTAPMFDKVFQAASKILTTSKK